jgi:hypothetical protein
MPDQHDDEPLFLGPTQGAERHSQQPDELLVAKLNTLLRKAYAREHAQSAPALPSDDDIWAYVTGNATDIQLVRVQRAIEISRAFCQELADLRVEMGLLMHPEARVMAESVKPSHFPSLRELEAYQHQRFLAAAAVAAVAGLSQQAAVEEFKRFSLRNLLAQFRLGGRSSSPLRKLKADKEYLAFQRAMRKVKFSSTLTETAVMASQSIFLHLSVDRSLTGRSYGSVNRGEQGTQGPRQSDAHQTQDLSATVGTVLELEMRPSTELINVTVWAPTSMTSQSMTHGTAIILNEGGHIWKQSLDRSLITIDGKSAFHFILNRKALIPGVITIQIEVLEDIPHERVGWAVFTTRFRVIDEQPS